MSSFVQFYRVAVRDQKKSKQGSGPTDSRESTRTNPRDAQHRGSLQFAMTIPQQFDGNPLSCRERQWISFSDDSPAKLISRAWRSDARAATPSGAQHCDA
jgi:hypothetical protein